ncbi:hypothetical protein BRADI_1g64232v3 [Brachypodium distachyon]|uniref:[RNA-polymerase]-subunit kinase n=1 Tax=Brachypodium distachyon TaxID=15368 RepID=A0A0Q3LG19_BRADI|nr:hypothetical protein BRADI_1g64232v3 [Brachypodium distachyon]
MEFVEVVIQILKEVFPRTGTSGGAELPPNLRLTSVTLLEFHVKTAEFVPEQARNFRGWSPSSTSPPTRPASSCGRLASFLEACSGNPYVLGCQGLARDPRTGNLCFVMEYVEALSLNDLFWETRHGPRLPEPTVRAFMRKLLTGAKMMHECHVVHRDIKPANILVAGAEEEDVRSWPLGLAISMTDPPPYNQAGTLTYMAPEMLLEKTDYDALVDTWSLGCVMAELVTGEALFNDEDDKDDGNESLSQLCSIFSVLGVPSDKSWPEFMSLPLAGEALRVLPAMVHPQHSKLREMFPKETLSADGFRVLEGLLTCNPAKWLTAAAALKLPWFVALRPAAATAATTSAPALPTKKP